jgi:hypothetical protein
MPYTRNRRRPSAYVGGAVVLGKSIVLSSGRGDTKLTPAEAVELARDLLTAATGTEPAGDLTDWVLRLAARVAAQSEILQATARRK